MKATLLLFLALLTSCSYMHHMQVGEINNSNEFIKTPIDVKISEVGFSLQEATDVAKIITKDKQDKQLEELQNIIALFQMGPVTGKPVYVDNYAKDVLVKLYSKCPSGNITGITSIRETNSYPVVSGEIIKITAYCLQRKS